MLFSIRAAADAVNERGGIDQAIVLPIRTGVIVALEPEVQPGSLNIYSGITVGIVAADPLPPRLPIATGVQVIANGTLFRPISTGVTVLLVPGQLPGAIAIRTGITVSLNVAGQPGFSRTRDLVIAAQSDLGAQTLTEVVLLGIEFTDPEFRSVENLGFIRLNGAEDIQFSTLPGDVGMSHNIVSHDPVTGRLVFDLKLASWTTDQDFPFRMFYGGVGQLPSRIGIATGVTVAITPEASVISIFPKQPPVATGITRTVGYALPAPAVRHGTVNGADDAGLTLALAAANPGDQILLADGTYAATRDGSGSNPAAINCDGSEAGGHIVIRARNHRGAITTGHWQVNGDYVWITGLTMQRPGQDPGSNGSAQFDTPSYYSVNLRGDNQLVTNCRVDSPNGIRVNSDASTTMASNAGIFWNDFTANTEPRYKGSNCIYIGNFITNSRGPTQVTIARNKWYSSLAITVDRESQRYCIYTGNSQPFDNNTGNNRTIVITENFQEMGANFDGIYVKRGVELSFNFINVTGESHTLRHGGYSNTGGTVFANLTDAVRALIQGNNFDGGNIIIEDTDHLLVGNRIADDLNLHCGTSTDTPDPPRPRGGPYHNAASRLIMIGNTIVGNLNLGRFSGGANHEVNDYTGGNVSGVVNFAAGITQPSGARLVRTNVVNGTAGYDEQVGDGGRPDLLTRGFPSRADLEFATGCDTDPSIVAVAPLIGLTRSGSQLLQPTAAQLGNTLPGNVAGNVDSNQNFQGLAGFTGVTNLTLDLRGRKFYHHSLNSFTGDGNRPGQNSPLRPSGFSAGLCIYGVEIIGEQVDNTIWATMKTDNPAAMDDNGILFPNPSVPAAATVYVEASVFRKSFDGINTDPRYGANIANKGHYIVRGCYMDKMRDEGIENDSLQYLEVYDVLCDACHNFISMRPGGDSSAVPPDYSDVNNRVKIYNVLARCRGQYYTTDVGGDALAFGTKRDPQFEVTGSAFVTNPTTYGPGWVSREPLKLSGAETFTNFNATMWVDCRDSIFAIEGRPTAGPVVFPPGTYDNVFLLVLCDVPTQGLDLDDFVDSTYVQDRGITVLTGAAARTKWSTERSNWISAHNGFIDTDGLLRFPFHAAP